MTADFHEDRLSTVCIDSVEVKRIRESMQLTQLYVSKVVGVTTDTISRWENNRYPTIRRDNALKLAEALEVPLSEILLKPLDDLTASEATPWKKKPLLWILFVLLLLVACFALISLRAPSPPAPSVITAERLLPAYAGPGSIIPVQIRLTHRAESGGVILREYFPKGWKILQAHPPASSLDNVHGIARWIIKAGDDRERVVYLVQVSPETKLNSEAVFQGEVVTSSVGSQSAVTTLGETALAVAAVHWADANGDSILDDGEMLKASSTYEDMAGVHMDWDALEALWDAGGYRWDAGKGRFLPVTEE